MDETTTYISFSVPVEISEPSFDQCHHMITFVSSFLLCIRTSSVVAQHEAGKSRRVCGLDSDTVHSKLTLYPIIYDVIRHKTVILPYPFFSRMLVYVV